jgi:oligopeptide transport system ATP-binding protein
VDLVRRLQEELLVAVMWITHDLGVIAELAHMVNVMYAGFIIERGDVREIFKHTRHPYTIGLLESLPRIDAPPGAKLSSIPGLPPDLLLLPPGCPFVPRCPYAIDHCREEMPPLEEVDGRNHSVACWRWEEIEGRVAK